MTNQNTMNVKLYNFPVIEEHDGRFDRKDVIGISKSLSCVHKHIICIVLSCALIRITLYTS